MLLAPEMAAGLQSPVALWPGEAWYLAVGEGMPGPDPAEKPMAVKAAGQQPVAERLAPVEWEAEPAAGRVV